MAEKYFRRTRFDSIIGGSERLVRELDKLSQAEARGVVIVLVADLLDSAPWYGDTRAQDYRRLARSLGVSAADLFPETTEPRRLDFATGVQLVGNEALGEPSRTCSALLDRLRGPGCLSRCVLRPREVRRERPLRAHDPSEAPTS